MQNWKTATRRRCRTFPFAASRPSLVFHSVCVKLNFAIVTCFLHFRVLLCTLSLCVSPAFQIRRQMIDGKSGQRKIKTLIKSVDEASHQYMKLNHDPKQHLPEWCCNECERLSMFCICRFSLIMGDDARDAKVTHHSLFAVSHRGTSTRPCGRTRGRLWRAQITGRLEMQARITWPSGKKMARLEPVSEVQILHLKSVGVESQISDFCLWTAAAHSQKPAHSFTFALNNSSEGPKLKSHFFSLIKILVCTLKRKLTAQFIHLKTRLKLHHNDTSSRQHSANYSL